MAIGEPSIGSGELSVGTTVVCSKACLVTGIVLSPAAAASSVKIYNHGATATSLQLTVLAAASTASTVVNLDSAMYLSAGCVAVVAGTGALATILYQRMDG